MLPGSSHELPAFSPTIPPHPWGSTLHGNQHIELSNGPGACVDAYAIHALLSIGRRFNAWFRPRVKDWGLIDGADFKIVVRSARVGSGLKKADRTSCMVRLHVALELVANASTPETPSIRAYLISRSSEQPNSSIIPMPTLASFKPSSLPPAPAVPKKQSIPKPPSPASEPTGPANPINSVAVKTSTVGGIECLTVDALELHQALGVGRDFSTWIKNRLSQFGFEQSRDFDVTDLFDSAFLVNQTNVTAIESVKRGGDRETKKYTLTLDTAKQLAMVERTEQGKFVRRYFIDCERKFYESQAAVVGQAELPGAMKTAEARENAVFNNDGYPFSELYALGALFKAINKRVISLALPEFARSLLLTRDLQVSSNLFDAYSARLHAQAKVDLKLMEDSFEPVLDLKKTLEAVASWTPLID